MWNYNRVLCCKGIRIVVPTWNLFSFVEESSTFCLLLNKNSSILRCIHGFTFFR